jgi:sterol desaturase/sphingolipid hydroxylase (fatty acid hydroxylase superfamily)
MANDSAIRLIAFLVIFVVVACAECVWPRRSLTVSKKHRWICNLSIVVIDSVTVRLFIPLMPLAMAETAASMGWGLFNLLVMPNWVEVLLTVLMLDLVIYLQHCSFHRVALFWRFHRMHHTDLDLDVSSGNRFHPVEMLLSLIIKLAAVVMLGAPVVAVLIFEVILNAGSLFNHGNMFIPTRVDKWLRLLVVTPDMHRVHHSIIPSETDSNFSFNFPWWDRILKTYRDQPQDGHDGMSIGLNEFRVEQQLGLGNLLLLPFRDRRGQ